MPRRTALALSLIAAVALASPLLHATEAAAPAADAKPAPDPAKVERGRYLVTLGLCNDCHTPWHLTENGPEPDMSRMLSGHPQDVEVPPPPALGGYWVAGIGATNTAWAGPWGVSFTQNLTPDPETGVGAWEEAEFFAALRSGRHRGQGRPILPPMPWPFISQATDEDLSAMFAYLQSIPPIKNRVPDPIPPVASH